MFADYDCSNPANDRAEATGFLGPTSADVRLYLNVLEKARSQSFDYKAKQLRDINLGQYIQDGMNLDMLTRGDYNTKPHSSSRSRDPKRQVSYE
jgi:hypothetical protein